MEYMFANLIGGIINVFFKGGVEEFGKLGRVSVIPFPAKELCVFHPDLSTELVQKLKAAEKNKGMNTVHIMSEENFRGMDDNQLRSIHVDLNRKIEKLDPNANILMCQKSNLLVLTFPDIKDTNESILDLVFGILRDLDGLRLAYVITAKSVYKIIPEPKSKQIPKLDKGAHTFDDISSLIKDLERPVSSEDLLQ